jgi:hypothetical protein
MTRLATRELAASIGIRPLLAPYHHDVYWAALETQVPALRKACAALVDAGSLIAAVQLVMQVSRLITRDSFVGYDLAHDFEATRSLSMARWLVWNA